MLNTFIPIILMIGFSTSPSANAVEEVSSLTCESQEVIPSTRVPVVTVVAPKIYEKTVPVLLLTVRKTTTEIPTGYSCRVQRINEGRTELMDLTCVSQDQKEHLKIYVSRSPNLFVANVVHRIGSATHELDNLTCRASAPRVTREN